MSICGIYKYENNINHKVYVGQSVDCQARYRMHKYMSLHQELKEYNLPIHKALAKYGLHNFTFTIIEECSKEKLNEREAFWIRHCDSDRKGYNATLGGDESHIHFGVPIELFDLEGTYVATYPNITEAAKAIGVSRNTIYGIIYGNRLSTRGFQFRRVGENKEITKYSNRQGGKIKIGQIDKESNRVIKVWESSYQAARELGLDSSAIIKCCKGKLKSTGGFKWAKI